MTCSMLSREMTVFVAFNTLHLIPLLINLYKEAESAVSDYMASF